MPDEPESRGDPVGNASTEAAEQPAEEQGSSGAGLTQAIEPPPGNSELDAALRRARLAEDRLAEVLAAYRKLKAEDEAHRLRVTRNIERRFEQRLEKLLVQFIDILDNFDRALEATERTYAGNPLIEGLILVRTQLLQTVQDQGLERIPALGLPFDPAHSEAVETRVVDDPDHHHVVLKELLRGYRIHGRVVRPSRVVVGEHPGGSVTPEPTDSGAGHALEALAEVEPVSAESNSAGEPSLEDIVNMAEAQEALFPEAFDDEVEPKKD